MMRLAAIGLLLLMVFDLGADFVNGETGDFLGPMPIPYDSHSTLASPQVNGQDTPLNSNHECFCCCSHLEQEGANTPHVALDRRRNSVHIATSLLDPDPAHIYHPPQQLF
jgi:hypothetical protein